MSLFLFLFSAYLIIISSIEAVTQDFYWRDYTYGDTPCDAYQGAPGLYIGQVKTKEHNIVANIYPNSGHAITTYAGEVLIMEDDIKILSSGDQSKFYWEDVDFDHPQNQQLQNAVRGGYHDNTHDPLFIGKVMHQDEWKIGKVHTFKHNDRRGIWVWDQRQHPVNIHQFHILKFNITVPDAVVRDFYWRDYEPEDIPCDAYEGAPGRYVGQMLVSHDDHNFIEPATIYPHTSTAVSELHGKKTAKKHVKILCSPDNSRFYWEYVDFTKSEDTQLRDAVIGGNEFGNTYIGKTLHEGEWKISKVISYEGKVHKGLHIWDKKEDAVHVHQFYILKYNSTKTCHRHCHK